MFRAVVTRVGSSRPMAPRLRALCTQKPATAGSTGKEVAAEPTTTNRNKDGVATYNYGESLNLPEVTKEQAENAYLEATDVKRAMTPPISVAVEARDDMLKDRFNYVASMRTQGPNPGLAGRVPGRPAPHACAPCLGQTTSTRRTGPSTLALTAPWSLRWAHTTHKTHTQHTHTTHNTEHRTHNTHTQHAAHNTQHTAQCARSPLWPRATARCSVGPHARSPTPTHGAACPPRASSQSISGMSFLIASGLVLMAGVTGVVYIRTQVR